jgi:hypothetical protein
MHGSHAGSSKSRALYKNVAKIVVNYGFGNPE